MTTEARAPHQSIVRRADDPVVLVFAVPDGELRLPVEMAARERSPHTDRELRRMTSVVTLTPEAAGATNALLQRPAPADDDGVHWRGRLESESYTNGGPHRLVIQWSEVEVLKATSIEFEGLDLRPCHYAERTDDGAAITVNFQATLSPEQTTVLRALQAPRADGAREYWPVVRRGVSDQPRRMRFGRILWQPRDDGHVDHDVTLVDEAYDAVPGQSSFLALAGQPQVGRLMAQVATLSAQVEALADALTTNGALDPATTKRIHDAGLEAARAGLYTFFEVDDLSRWWDSDD